MDQGEAHEIPTLADELLEIYGFRGGRVSLF